MTAGDLFGIGAGYYPQFSVGSIDAEPIPGETLVQCYSATGSGSILAFSGDIVSVVTGKTVWIDSVEYAPDVADWNFDGTNTRYQFTAEPFSMGNSYFIEIKGGGPPPSGTPKSYGFIFG